MNSLKFTMHFNYVTKIGVPNEMIKVSSVCGTAHQTFMVHVCSHFPCYWFVMR